jgi:hypothetical protein
MYSVFPILGLRNYSVQSISLVPSLAPELVKLLSQSLSQTSSRARQALAIVLVPLTVSLYSPG